MTSDKDLMRETVTWAMWELEASFEEKLEDLGPWHTLSVCTGMVIVFLLMANLGTTA